MTSRLISVTFDANDPVRLARFWATALHWDIDQSSDDEIDLVPTDNTRFRIVFISVPEEKMGRNRVHLDLTTTSFEDQDETVRELIAIGAHHIDIGQGPDEPHVVLCDRRQRVLHHRTDKFVPRRLRSPGSGELRWIKGDWILLE
ncbi:MAG: VOC family protein [Acidimicrobiales bacterium]